jgi:circadian clock protein KaiC
MEHSLKPLPKSPSGIKGFDEITFGGLAKGRPTLVCGGAGSGKTLFGMEFLVRGAAEFDEPGLFVSFEESESDLLSNFASLGFDLKKLETENKISIDYVHIERSEIEETGEYDLEGLFVRMGFAIDAIGAKRVVLDTLEALFSAFSDQFILRSELRRLFRWLKDRGLTAVITAERGDEGSSLTRHGLEEYVSDCVISLEHNVVNRISTRRLRVVKYRGTIHGTNEYPFLIDEGGFSVLPITSVGLDYQVSSERISSGIPQLDAMLGRNGYFRGSSILVSGAAGTGKSSFSGFFADSTCRGNENCLYYAFEESSSQIIRNMRSIGIDLEQWVDKGLLRFQTIRPTFYGLERHIAEIQKNIIEFNPSVIILDPISNMESIGSPLEIKIALMRLIDLLKSRLVTTLFTYLLQGEEISETEIGVSSLMDTWIMLREVDSMGERNRVLNIVKSRGMAHSNQMREFRFSQNGIKLIDVYTGPEGVLTGAARISQESREKAEAASLEQEIARRKGAFERRRQDIDAQISMLRMQLEAEEEEIEKQVSEHESRLTALTRNRRKMEAHRWADNITDNDRK